MQSVQFSTISIREPCNKINKINKKNVIKEALEHSSFTAHKDKTKINRKTFKNRTISPEGSLTRTKTRTVVYI